MKRTIPSIAALLVTGALALQAATEKVATVQVADMQTIVSSANAAGEMVGYPILGSVVSMAIAENNPLAEFTGELAANEAVALEIYADTEIEDIEADIDDFADSFKATLIFAPKGGKNEYLAKMPRAKDNGDGSYTIKGAKSRETNYVTFSPDGKWAVLADDKALAAQGLADLQDGIFAKAQLKGGVARVFIQPSLMKIASSGIELAIKEIDAANEDPAMTALAKDILKTVQMIESFELIVKLDRDGLDLFGSVKPIAGTELDKLGTIALGADPLAKAAPDAFYAIAAADNSGYDGVNYVAAIVNLVGFFSENGLKTDWFKNEVDGTFYKWNLDIFGAISYFQGEGAEASSRLDPEAFLERFKAILPFCTLKAGTPGFGLSLAIPEVKPTMTPNELFVKAIADYQSRKPFEVGVFSFYTLVKGIAPKVVEMAAPAEDAQMLNMMIETLPESNSTMAAAISRDYKGFNYLIRIPADEIKGISALVNVGMSYAMMKSLQTVESSSYDMDDDDDDDDCEGEE